jgi:hypothetical protein
MGFCCSAVTHSSKELCDNQDISSEFTRKVQTAFLDGLYAFLDGLVHVAFSGPDSMFTINKTVQVIGTAAQGATSGKESNERDDRIDFRNVVSSSSFRLYSVLQVKEKGFV